MPTFVISGKKERGSETIYAENARMWTSSLVGGKEV